jgi:hypothetical protein
MEKYFVTLHHMAHLIQYIYICLFLSYFSSVFYFIMD